MVGMERLNNDGTIPIMRNTISLHWNLWNRPEERVRRWATPEIKQEL